MTNTIKYLFFLGFITSTVQTSNKTKDNNQKKSYPIGLSKNKPQPNSCKDNMITVQDLQNANAMEEAQPKMFDCNGLLEKLKEQNKIMAKIIQDMTYMKFVEEEKLKQYQKQVNEQEQKLEKQEKECEQQQKELKQQQKELENLLKEDEQQQKELEKQKKECEQQQKELKQQQKELENLLKEDEKQQKETKEKGNQLSIQLDTTPKEVSNNHEQPKTLLARIDKRINIQKLKHANIHFQQNHKLNISHQKHKIPVHNTTKSSWLESILLVFFGISISIK